MTNADDQNFAHACRALRRLIHAAAREHGVAANLNEMIDGGEWSTDQTWEAYDCECERLADLVADAFDVDDMELSEQCYHLDDYENHKANRYANDCK